MPAKKILVVEDQSDVRAFSIQVLRDLGYQVLEAPDGPMARREIKILGEWRAFVNVRFWADSVDAIRARTDTNLCWSVRDR